VTGIVVATAKMHPPEVTVGDPTRPMATPPIPTLDSKELVGCVLDSAERMSVTGRWILPPRSMRRHAPAKVWPYSATSFSVGGFNGGTTSSRSVVSDFGYADPRRIKRWREVSHTAERVEFDIISSSPSA
jgi:hypothetical protein